MQRFAYQESCPYQARRCTLRRPPARSRTPSGCSSTQKHTRAIRRHRHIEQPPTVLTARRPATQSTFVHSVDRKHIFRLHQKRQKHIGIGRRRNHPNLFVFGKSLYQSGGLSRLYIVEKERLRFVRWTARGINIPLSIHVKNLRNTRRMALAVKNPMRKSYRSSPPCPPGHQVQHVCKVRLQPHSFDPKLLDHNAAAWTDLAGARNRKRRGQTYVGNFFDPRIKRITVGAAISLWSARPHGRKVDQSIRSLLQESVTL